MKEGYIPPVLNLNLVDQILDLDGEDAILIAKEISRKEGIFVGPSSGAAMYLAIQKAKEMSSGNIAVIFPDRGEKYLSVLK